MFVTRLISSIVLAAAALMVILQGGYLLAGTLFVISVIAYRELMQACGLKVPSKINALEVTGYLSITAYYLVMVFSPDAKFLFFIIIMSLVAFMFVYVFSFPRYRAEQIMSAFFHVVYAPVMLSCIYLTRSLTYGIFIVWMIFISSWICDTCAYCVGMLIGRHKMAPRLSPKKSVEGALGGIAGSAIVGGLYAYFVVNQAIFEQDVVWIFALISAVGAVIAQVGDLAASAIKRDYDIKDYGKLIPGHGGIMDRFDSVIFTAPVIYFLAILLIYAA